MGHDNFVGFFLNNIFFICSIFLFFILFYIFLFLFYLIGSDGPPYFSNLLH